MSPVTNILNDICHPFRKLSRNMQMLTVVNNLEVHKDPKLYIVVSLLHGVTLESFSSPNKSSKPTVSSCWILCFDVCSTQ